MLKRVLTPDQLTELDAFFGAMNLRIYVNEGLCHDVDLDELEDLYTEFLKSPGPEQRTEYPLTDDDLCLICYKFGLSCVCRKVAK
jgi:hypothetical protein